MQFADLGVSGDGTAGAVGDGAFYDGSESACKVGEKGGLTVIGIGKGGFYFWVDILFLVVVVVERGLHTIPHRSMAFRQE